MRLKSGLTRKTKKQINTDFAVMLEWRKCLRLVLLWLKENTDIESDGYMEFVHFFHDYFYRASNDDAYAEQLEAKFREYTDMDIIGDLELKGNRIQQSVKVTQAVCLRVAGIILMETYEFSKEWLEYFVKGMWEYIAEYPKNSNRIAELEKETDIKIAFNKL